MGKRGKGKNTRRRSEKVLRTKRKKSRKYKHSAWKLKLFPKLFRQVSYYPYIVRKDDKRFK